MATIADFKGTQLTPQTEHYQEASYQYATSTYGAERGLAPALVVQPRDVTDISAALRHARDKGIAVAVRTGGHQYSGASSASAPNMQMDLRNTFKGPDDLKLFTGHHDDGKEVTLVRAGVSWSLGEFNAWLGKNGVFVPHGQCTGVHLGGHVQSGGYGQLARSFGLLGDHVVALELVDADGKVVEVTRSSDPDRFFGLLGGSPGNLGVVTHVSLRVHRDADYEGAKGMRALFLYSRSTLERLLGVVARMADDQDTPRNYDLCVSVLSESFPLLDLLPDLDEKMARKHPNFYGTNGLFLWPKCIVVYAQWVPFESGQVPDMAWFDELKAGSLDILGRGDVHTKPMSSLTAEWIFRNQREFEHPYVKRTYTTASRTLVKDGWPAWAASRIDAIVDDEENRCWLSAQLQVFGGRHSMASRNQGNGTAFSWRDTTVACTMDCFHEHDAKTRAEDWVAVNDAQAIGEKGIFSKTDRRWLWGSYGNWDMDNVWQFYYEDKDKYERLQRVRKVADPYGTFTPNPFCVKRAE